MRRITFYVVAGVLFAGSFSAGSLAQAQTKDEQAIRALEDQFAAAFRAKDADAIMKVYAPGSELFVFDAVPPRQYAGFDAYKKDWQSTLAGFSGPLEFDISDLSITTDGKLAFSHSVQHLSGTAKDGSKVEMAVRVTDCYRKIAGRWLITHEHVSFPVDVASGKADLMSRP